MKTKRVPGVKTRKGFQNKRAVQGRQQLDAAHGGLHVGVHDSDLLREGFEARNRSVALQDYGFKLVLVAEERSCTSREAFDE